VLSAKKWEGADIKDVIDATLEPFASADPDRIRVIGPPVQMSARSVVMLSMVLHELATNASKYGALWSCIGGSLVDPLSKSPSVPASDRR
jgi:two-component sensor histidine kinase